MMDEATYKARVDAFLSDMRARGVAPEAAAEMLAQLEQTDKTAAAQRIAYKVFSSAPQSSGKPSRESDQLEQEMRAVGLDPDSAQAEAVWDVWVQYGLKSARAELASASGAWLTDSGRPLLWRE